MGVQGRQDRWHFIVSGAESIQGVEGKVLTIPIKVPATATVGDVFTIGLTEGIIFTADGTQENIGVRNGSVKIVRNENEKPDSPDYIISNIQTTNSEVIGWNGYFSNFNYCTSLEKVTCLSATPPAIYSNPFSYVDRSKVTLVVPAFAVVDYKLDTYWHEFGSIIEGAETEFLNIGSTLTLTNNRRPAKKVDVLLDEGGSLIVGGNAPFEVGALTFTVNTPHAGR